LLAQLSASLGKTSAQNELRWMKDALRRTRPVLPPATDLASMVARRARGEPLQYILGTQPFGPLELLVRPPVLIPRPETEDWVLRLADILHPMCTRPARVLDLCTGSGCIPLLLCALWPQGSTSAVGVDIADEALTLATDNARECGVPLLGDAGAQGPPPRLHNGFLPLHGDLRAPDALACALPLKPYTLITANPPYIPPAEYAALDASVRDHEDARALLGDGPDGLGFYHAIAELVCADGVLDEDAVLALEVGKGQADAVRAIVKRTGAFTRTEVWRDPWGIERVVV
ncbi:S-adenosyl-L-methionine-dependent methyltransferase, partial [Vararia minispora EC-137]